MKNSTDDNPQGAWLPVYAALVGVALVIADRLDIAPGLAWGWFIPAGLGGAILAAVITLIQGTHRGVDVPFSVVAHRVLVLLLAGAWCVAADMLGWTTWTVLLGIGGTVAMSAIGAVCQMPPAQGRVQAVQYVDDRVRDVSPRAPSGKTYQAIMRDVTAMKSIVVTSWERWENPKNGLRLFVELPVEMGTSAADIAPLCYKIGAAARLDRGCLVEVKDSARQGIVVVDVQLRNLMEVPGELHVEPTTPASIRDDFPILTTPRGDILSICLRIYSMILGGTTGSGKTTVLHRIIMFLARCTDTLVWVIDPNGGGVAEPWIAPWLDGKTRKPIVDWVASTEEEAAVMVAVAAAVAKNRKSRSNAAAWQRKDQANDTVLPVDAKMPAIVVITDEGGEVRKAVSLVGTMVGQGISTLAQIGRAEGVRTIMSVLRGTADLTAKDLRVVSAIRLCLRMDEDGEYPHVLDATPPRNTDLSGATGAGFLRTATIRRPLLGRTVNVDLRTIKVHALATAHLRPDLDADGLRAAARVTPAMVLGGRDPKGTELMDHPAFQDCLAGRAYLGRWDRYRAAMEMELDDQAVQAASGARAAAPLSVTVGGALAAWGAAIGPAAPAARPTPAAEAATTTASGGQVIQMFGRGREQQTAPAPAAPATAREQILALLQAAGAAGVSTGELVRQVDATNSPSRVKGLLAEMVEAGKVVKSGAGNVLADFAQTVGSSDLAGPVG